MVESLVWSPESIMDLSKDTLIDTETTGTVTLSDSVLELNGEARAVFSYTYDAAENILETSDLQLVLDVINSDTTINSRYDESVQVELYMQYYKEELDSSGNVTGYVLGHTETYQINPYFKHEIEGYTNTYEISVDKNRVVYIEVHFINVSENIVKFVNPKIYNSMKVLDAINEYGGGDSGDSGGGSVPLLKDLTIYVESGSTTLKHFKDKVVLGVAVPHDLLLKYNDGDIHWTITALTGEMHWQTGYESYYERVETTNDEGEPITKDFYISAGKMIFSGLSDGTVKIRASLSVDNTIYDERNISIINCDIKDYSLVVNTEDGKIHGNGANNVTVKLLPLSGRTNIDTWHDGINVSIKTYDTGQAKLSSGHTSGSFKVIDDTFDFSIYGVVDGKILITLENDNTNCEYYPGYFYKEFIVDVVNTVVVPDVYISSIDEGMGDGTSESYNISVSTTRSYSLRTDSGYGIESVDGNGKAYVKCISTGNSRTLTYEICPIALGKVKFYGNMHEYVSGGSVYVGRVEYEFEITSLFKELTGIVETNTGLFEITQGAGQLEVYPRPNYSYYGGYSFSQVSIDGGSVSISDKGDYALITGDKEGRLELICKPTYGPNLSCEISVSNQYPEDVKLTTADNIFKVPINGSLMIYAEANDNPNPNFNKYNWAIEKLDADGGCSYNYWNDSIKLTGTSLGKLRLNCARQVDNKYLTSQVVKVVQSLDSDKTVLTYPNTQQYWVVYRRTDQSNRLWLLTIDGTVILDKLIKTTSNRLNTDNITLGAYEQYRIESGQWYKHGNWTGSTSPAGSVGQLYASNLDIYDEEGNLLVAKTDNYDDVDFDAIIYGQDVYILSTSEEGETETTE